MRFNEVTQRLEDTRQVDKRRFWSNASSDEFSFQGIKKKECEEIVKKSQTVIATLIFHARISQIHIKFYTAARHCLSACIAFVFYEFAKSYNTIHPFS